MKVTYDPEVDVLRILLQSGPVEESDESKPGVILDYDKEGNIVGVEILNASRRTDNPRSMEYAILQPDRQAAVLREQGGSNYTAGPEAPEQIERKED